MLQIKNPSLGTVVGWNSSQNDFVTASIRETGLYHICFKRLAGSSSSVDVFYAFDVVTTGVFVARCICVVEIFNLG